MHASSPRRHAPDSLGAGPGAGGINHSPGSAIRHSTPGIGNGLPPSSPAPTPVPRLLDDEPKPQIRTFEQTFSARADEQWKRKPTANGTGAVHVRTFHCKLTGDCLENLDRQVNEWLDAHPEFEVKFVTSSVGDWTGKLKEPNLIIQVWV